MRREYRGLGTALVTPFRDGKVDYDAFRALVRRQVEAGVDFLVPLGSTAETPCLEDEEKVNILKITKEESNGLPIVAGVGSNSPAATIRNMRLLDPFGADAYLVVVPFYNKPEQEGIYQYFKTIAEATDRDVILYNVPGRTGVNLLPETVMRIYEAHPDKIVGIKEASGNIEQIKKLIQLSNTPSLEGRDGEGFPPLLVISGDDGIACEVMEAGGAGLISVASNAFPEDFWHIVHDKDRALQTKYDEMVKLLFAEGNPVGIKAVLTQKGIIQNYLRLPLVPASEELEEKIKKELA